MSKGNKKETSDSKNVNPCDKHKIRIISKCQPTDLQHTLQVVFVWHFAASVRWTLVHLSIMAEITWRDGRLPCGVGTCGFWQRTLVAFVPVPYVVAYYLLSLGLGIRKISRSYGLNLKNHHEICLYLHNQPWRLGPRCRYNVPVTSFFFKKQIYRILDPKKYLHLYPMLLQSKIYTFYTWMYINTVIPFHGCSINSCLRLNSKCLLFPSDTHVCTTTDAYLFRFHRSTIFIAETTSEH